MADKIEVKVPDIGDFDEVEVIDVLVAEGDSVEAEDGLITLETDKAAMDVPAPQAGKVASLKVASGDKVSEGTVIAELEAADAGADAEPAAKDDAQEASETPAPSQSDEADDSSSESEEKKTPAGEKKEVEITVPDIGDFDEVELIDVLVSEGDEVEEEQGIVTLETDKAAMDVPAPHGGTIKSVKVTSGDKVSQGSVVAVMEALIGGESSAAETPADKKDEKAAASDKQSDEKAAPAPKAQSSDKPKAESKPDRGSLPAIDESGFAKAHASPSVRKFARELGADLVKIHGSGYKGRITHDDVKKWVKSQLRGASGGGGLPQVPDIDHSQFGDVERVALSRIKKISGPRLQASWVNAPHVTQHDDADITKMDAVRKALKSDAEAMGIKMTPLAFIMKACVHALREFPDFNSSLDPDGEHLVMKKYFHLGFAADTPNGLVVPVIRDVDEKSVFDVAGELGDLAKKARDGKLQQKHMQGACFTVSSLGGIGGTAFTPIVNAPEVAILGVSKAEMKPVWNGQDFEPRLTLPLSLSYDHRVIDGAAAARFTRYLADVLGECRNLVM
ncbi:pyruvate dehydrogenase E2 component (dihydrolipoamide acetyltransferase) [Natronospira proteinivora]|uniref:Acetyltransferase component of pyruvate dehydrogenase complex n=1 Tax=Natronospira proteinivora TaxID=1807133 RepID=A0ABT1G8F9_9GAMM|nr:dihydrolipoyllysine-residue acetyltransferase [Natronospira proteinivora]MCP1726247.1 pyruvate dehydrogenase E2 component (dihydrolipoamide acetyltransferase) [Natronospira proteinivora]